MKAKTVAYIGSVPVQTDEYEFDSSPMVDPEFTLIYEAAILLRNGGMSNSAAIKTASDIYDTLAAMLRKVRDESADDE